MVAAVWVGVGPMGRPVAEADVVGSWRRLAFVGVGVVHAMEACRKRASFLPGSGTDAQRGEAGAGLASRGRSCSWPCAN
jgi:hypothetical protein